MENKNYYNNLKKIFRNLSWEELHDPKMGKYLFDHIPKIIHQIKIYDNLNLMLTQYESDKKYLKKIGLENKASMLSSISDEIRDSINLYEWNINNNMSSLKANIKNQTPVSKSTEILEMIKENNKNIN